MLITAISTRTNIHQTAGENICSKQEKQRRDYNRRHQVPNKIEVGQRVFLKKQRRMEIKRGGQFTVHSISNKILLFLN